MNFNFPIKRVADMPKLVQAMLDHTKVKLSSRSLVVNPDEAFVLMSTSQNFLDTHQHLPVDIVKEP